LPLAFKEVLLLMGHEAGGFLRGSEFLYDDLAQLTNIAAEMLQDARFPERLPPDAFVFFMHQGYQFNFFRVCEGDDPPVYRFYEGKDMTTFPRIYPAFTFFMITELADHASAQPQSRARPPM
jgi:hypothetical protein